MTKRLLAIKSMQKVSLGLSSTSETRPPNLHFTRMPNYVILYFTAEQVSANQGPISSSRWESQVLKACNLRQIRDET